MVGGTGGYTTGTGGYTTIAITESTQVQTSCIEIDIELERTWEFDNMDRIHKI